MYVPIHRTATKNNHTKRCNKNTIDKLERNTENIQITQKIVRKGRNGMKNRGNK